MLIHTYLYKNNILHKKNLNVSAIYDKTMQRLQFNEEGFEVDLILKNNNIYYKRTNKEYTFELKIEDNISNAKLNLLEYSQEMNINVIEHSFKITKNHIELTYRLETEDESLNKIIIKLEGEL